MIMKLVLCPKIVYASFVKKKKTDGKHRWTINDLSCVLKNLGWEVMFTLEKHKFRKIRNFVEKLNANKLKTI